MERFRMGRFGNILEVHAKENPTLTTKFYTTDTGFSVWKDEEGRWFVNGFPGKHYHAKKIDAFRWFVSLVECGMVKV